MLGGSLGARGAVELLRKFAAGRCEGLHRPHDRIATLDGGRPSKWFSASPSALPVMIVLTRNAGCGSRASSSRLNSGDAHEQLPQQPAAVILDHHDDRPLV